MVTLPTTIDVAAISDTGRVREHNEDAVWIGDAFFRDGFRSRRIGPDEVDGVVLAVADGVGGAAAGEVASRWVAEQMARRMGAIVAARGRGAPRGRVAMEAAMKRTAAEVNEELIREGERRPGRGGMATTWTGVVVSNAFTGWLNAGDSRLYCAHEGRVYQVSRDHTLREERGDPSIPGNIITNCFGMADDFRLDVGPLDPARCDAMLLCSDGLSDYADMVRVSELLRELPARDFDDDDAGYLEPIARSMLDEALAGGGGDNVTLLIVRPVYA